MIVTGLTPEEVVDQLPPVEFEDVVAALRFAADLVAAREIPATRGVRFLIDQSRSPILENLPRIAGQYAVHGSLSCIRFWPRRRPLTSAASRRASR